MKLSLRNLFAAAGLLVAVAGLGRAEEISLAPNFEPFADENITLVAHNAGGCDTGACNAGGCDNCNSCCTSRHVGRDFWVSSERCGGIIGGVEFLYLRPYAEGGVFDTGPGGADIGFQPAYRLWAGWENSDGLGARVRYFEIDADDATATSFLSVRYRYIDAEVTQAVAFRRSSLQFSGGARWADNENIVATVIPGQVVFATGSEFDGIGLTFAAQANRDITRNGALRMTANARWSLLYGNSTAVNIAIPPGVILVDDQRDNLMQIVELNVGPQFRRKMSSGGYLTAFAGVEAQYWHNGFSTTSLAGSGPGIDTGFAGLSTSVSITR